MSINEQVENLRRIAKEWNPDTPINPVSITLNQAVDIIESLSAKLQVANTERTKKYYNGEKSEYDIERILNCLDEIWTFGEEPTDDEREAARDAIDIIQNMERSAEDFGGWITDRIPTKEECGDSLLGKEFAVTIDSNGRKTMVMDFVYETVRGKEVSRWKWRDRISPWEVIAWHKLPEPYHEP